MYYHLKDHIYITQFKDELIILDTRENKYTICFNNITEMIKKILKAKYPLRNPNVTNDNITSLDESAVIQQLKKCNIIERQAFPCAYEIDIKENSEGVSNVDWRLPLINEKIKFNLTAFEAFLIICKVNYFIKFKGFYETIQLIKKSMSISQDYIIPTKNELDKLAQFLNKACFFYPTRIKCLEWAIAFELLALKRGWKCNLEIGVQNYPFYAHAWVECAEKVVMDDQNLRKGLAIILGEPFRRIRS